VNTSSILPYSQVPDGMCSFSCFACLDITSALHAKSFRYYNFVKKWTHLIYSTGYCPYIFARDLAEPRAMEVVRYQANNSNIVFSRGIKEI